MHQESGNGAIEIFWDIEYAPSDLLKQRRHVLIVKREGATEKSVQNNTAAPDINFRTRVQPRGKDENTHLKCKCHFPSTCTLFLYVPMYTVQTLYVLLSKVFSEVRGCSPTLNGCSPGRISGLTKYYSNFPRENSIFIFLTQTKLK